MKIKAVALAVAFAFAGEVQACWNRGPLGPRNWGQMRMAPDFVKTGSASNAFAQRITISSGSATVPFSSSVINSDSLIFHTVRASLPAAGGFEGWVNIASGGNVATGSTPVVRSGQNITLSPVYATNQASGFGRGFRVNSIVDGVSFAIATEDGQLFTGGAVDINWRIPEAILAR